MELLEQGRLEPGIMLVKMSHDVTSAQMEASQKAGTEEMLAAGDTQWVILFDMREGSIPKFDFNLAALRRLLGRDESYVVGYIVVGAHSATRFIIGTLSRIFNISLISTPNMETGLSEARILLDEAKARSA